MGKVHGRIYSNVEHSTMSDPNPNPKRRREPPPASSEQDGAPASRRERRMVGGRWQDPERSKKKLRADKTLSVRLTAAELSRRLRAAGYPLGAANISEHEAIAGTQAAIWRFTNSLELDNRPLNVPASVVHGPEGVTVEFDGERVLGGYEVDLIAAGSVVEVELHRSDDGSVWQPVDGSRLTLAAGTGTHHKGLGVGSTDSTRTNSQSTTREIHNSDWGMLGMVACSFRLPG